MTDTADHPYNRACACLDCVCARHAEWEKNGLIKARVVITDRDEFIPVHQRIAWLKEEIEIYEAKIAVLNTELDDLNDVDVRAV